MQLLGIPHNPVGLPAALHPLAVVEGVSIINGQLVLRISPEPSLTKHQYGFIGFVPNEEPISSDAKVLLDNTFYSNGTNQQIGRLIFRPCVGFDTERILG